MTTAAYDPTDDVARLTAYGYDPDQIEHILAVRRRLKPLSAGWRTWAAEEARKEQEEARKERERACPFMNLLGALRAALS